MRFDGASYSVPQDGARLAGQLARTKTLMLDGRWRSLDSIKAVVGGSESGVSARLRDLRKPRFGAYLVERRRVRGGLHEYRVVSPSTKQGRFDLGPTVPERWA